MLRCWMYQEWLYQVYNNSLFPTIVAWEATHDQYMGASQFSRGEINKNLTKSNNIEHSSMDIQ